MARPFIDLNESAILGSAEVNAAAEAVATSIVKTANRNTSAPVGITWRRVDEQTIRIGPRGAAAIAVEYGSRMLSARRPVKRALDAHEVR
jgi:hypothetical protein